jgi:hypothetical protein
VVVVAREDSLGLSPRHSCRDDEEYDEYDDDDNDGGGVKAETTAAPPPPVRRERDATTRLLITTIISVAFVVVFVVVVASCFLAAIVVGRLVGGMLPLRGDGDMEGCGFLLYGWPGAGGRVAFCSLPKEEKIIIIWPPRLFCAGAPQPPRWSVLAVVEYEAAKIKLPYL